MAEVDTRDRGNRLKRFRSLMQLYKEKLSLRPSVSPGEQIGAHVTEKGGILRSPYVVALDLTNSCNQNCIFCYRSGPKALMPNGKKIFRSLESLERLCRQFKEIEVASIALSGGEPTLHPDFIPAVETVKRHDLALTVVTNGTNLTEKSIRQMADVFEPERDKVELSFDAANSESYQKIRGSSRFKNLLSTIELLGAYGIPFLTMTLVVKENFHQIDEILELAFRHGAMERAVEPPFAKNHMAKNAYADTDDVLDLYLRLARDRNQQSSIQLNLLHFAISLGYLPELLAFFESHKGKLFTCHAGTASCAIDIFDNLHLCQFVIDGSATKVGNVSETSFPELWKEIQKVKRELSHTATEGLSGGCPAVMLEKSRSAQYIKGANTEMTYAGLSTYASTKVI
jgi:MoaA/NifB/PqqE/SkfB family radical SAM enzyme